MPLSNAQRLIADSPFRFRVAICGRRFGKTHLAIRELAKYARNPGPNIVNRDEYKMHILTRQYMTNEWEIVIERWIPESGWERCQILADGEEFDRIIELLKAARQQHINSTK